MVKKDETKKVKEVKKTKKTTVKKDSLSKQVKSELKKVKWPTKKEMQKYAIATLGFIIVFGLYFYGIDALFAWISSLVKGL